jgi:hypothetical protein
MRLSSIVAIALLHTIVGSNAELLRGIRREHPREQGDGGSRDDTNQESYISRRILKIYKRHDFFPSTPPDEEVTVHKHYWPLPPYETPDLTTATTTTATTTKPPTTTTATTSDNAINNNRHPNDIREQGLYHGRIDSD